VGPAAGGVRARTYILIAAMTIDAMTQITITTCIQIQKRGMAAILVSGASSRRAGPAL